MSTKVSGGSTEQADVSGDVNKPEAPQVQADREEEKDETELEDDEDEEEEEEGKGEHFLFQCDVMNVWYLVCVVFVI